MLMKQVDHNGGGDNVRYGDSFTDDQFGGETFDYLLDDVKAIDKGPGRQAKTPLEVREP